MPCSMVTRSLASSQHVTNLRHAGVWPICGGTEAHSGERCSRAGHTRAISSSSPTLQHVHTLTGALMTSTRSAIGGLSAGPPQQGLTSQGHVVGQPRPGVNRTGALAASPAIADQARLRFGSRRPPRAQVADNADHSDEDLSAGVPWHRSASPGTPLGIGGQSCGLFAVDIAGFTDPQRDEHVQLYLRDALYRML